MYSSVKIRRFIVLIIKDKECICEIKKKEIKYILSLSFLVSIPKTLECNLTPTLIDDS